jgi:hypothetical protein
MTGILRRLAFAGLVFVVLSGTACGARLTGSLQPKAATSPLAIPSNCAQAVYG